MVNKMSENFSAIRIGVDISKWHVWSFVHHFKYLMDMNLKYISDKDIKGTDLGSDPVFQSSLIVAWLSSYNVDRITMG